MPSIKHEYQNKVNNWILTLNEIYEMHYFDYNEFHSICEMLSYTYYNSRVPKDIQILENRIMNGDIHQLAVELTNVMYGISS